jgi:hypothetical protein
VDKNGLLDVDEFLNLMADVFQWKSLHHSLAFRVRKIISFIDLAHLPFSKSWCSVSKCHHIFFTIKKVDEQKMRAFQSPPWFAGSKADSKDLRRLKERSRP